MPKLITAEVVVAYAQCPRKAYLLLCTDEPGSPHEYPGILAQQQHANRVTYLGSFKKEHPDATPYEGKLPGAGHGALLAATLQTQDLEAYCDILTPTEHSTSTHGWAYEPTLVIGTHTISKEQRLELLYVGDVLGHLQRTRPRAGTLVGLGESVHRIPLAKPDATLDRILAALRAWTTAPPANAPPPILNKHCPECPFRLACTAQAEHDDDLSLLERITPKDRQRFHDRGIFTVRQLSYLYRPRKGKRRPAVPVRNQPELQALALRTGKTYLHELPALTRHPLELFLDIEGIPDRGIYYLFGLSTSDGGPLTYQHFWADTAEEEERIFRQLLTRLAECPNAPIYHYGSYEPRVIATLSRRYQADCTAIVQRLVNLNAFVHGKIYFPVRSNRLKDIGRFLGVSWTAPEASGLESLVWRHRWEETRQLEDKQRLLTYNREDGIALRALVEEFTRLRDGAVSRPEVDFAAQPKRNATPAGEEIHQQFGLILRSAHATYENAKISIRSSGEATPSEKRKIGGQPGHQGFRRIVPKARKAVPVAPRTTCPRCARALDATERLAEKTIVDLVFTKSGCRKTITRYVGAFGHCRTCGRDIPPAEIGAFGNRMFGHGFQAWILYARLVLRLPYRTITQMLEDQFRERISEGVIVDFLENFARDYAETEELCRQSLLRSSFIHVDETKINIQGTDHYVWVFTDSAHVLFRMTQTREATIVRELLADYDGVLISDFYGGYDAMTCRQQKCLVHLIRDLNEDLWRAPFDAEFEHFVLAVKNLIVPILDAANHYGLKKRHLGRFSKRVERFYQTVIAGQHYRSALTLTYQKRFQRYRSSLFTFLESDGIPWNNNMAERALRHLAVQRKISGSFYEAVATPYLLLLGIAQTCRFQGKSVLQFLLSGETNVDTFKSTKHRPRSRAAGTRTSRGRL